MTKRSSEKFYVCQYRRSNKDNWKLIHKGNDYAETYSKAFNLLRLNKESKAHGQVRTASAFTAQLPDGEMTTRLVEIFFYSEF